jgi:membrane-associated phospholipid phosphatase
MLWGRALLGRSGRIWAGWLLAACVIVVAGLGEAFSGQTRADAFDNAVDSPLITFLGGHYHLLTLLALPGTLVPATVISVAVAACCLFAGRLNGAVLALAAVPAATGLDDGLLKHVFDRTYLGSLSFPSGHTTSVVALTAMLAVLVLVPPRRPGTRLFAVLVVGVACVASAVVASAVIALRWHYFTDTVAGAAVGVGTVCVLALILDLAWRPRTRRPQRAETSGVASSAADHAHHVPGRPGR